MEDAAIFGGDAAERPRRARKPPLLPRFVFPDRDVENSNLYFADNIAGLNASLNAAIREGCLDGWPSAATAATTASTGVVEKPVEISVLLAHDTLPRPTSAFYVQYQMEQLASPWFDAGYVRKLRGALAVWDFSPRNRGFLRAVRGLTGGRVPAFARHQVHHVPMLLALDGKGYGARYCDDDKASNAKAKAKEEDAPVLCPVLYGRDANDVSGRRCYPGAALTGRPPSTDDDPGAWPKFFPRLSVCDRWH